MKTQYFVLCALALSAMAFLLGSAGIFLIIAGSALGFYAWTAFCQVKLNQRAYEAEIKNRETDAEFRSVVLSKVGILAYNRGELSFWSKRESLPDRNAGGLPEPCQVPDTMPDVMPLISDAVVLLIQGEQGAGKTTLLTNIIQDRMTRGQVLVIDSHGYDGKYGDGIPVVGAGRRYEDIDRTFADLLNLMTERYEDYHRVNHPMLYICIDEYTLLYKKCTAAKDFIESALTEFRKINFRLIACVHSLRAKFLNLEGGMDLADGLFKLCLKCENGRRWGELSKYQKSEYIEVALPGPCKKVNPVNPSEMRFKETSGQGLHPYAQEEKRAQTLNYIEYMPSKSGLHDGCEPADPVHGQIVRMWRNQASLNAIAMAVFKNTGGVQNRKIKEVLAMYGLL